ASAAGFSPRTAGNARRGPFGKGEPPAMLDAAQSAFLREKLMADVANIASPEVAARWAQNALGAKNSLMAADAKLVEDAFESRLSDLAPELPTSEAAAPPK